MTHFFFFLQSNSKPCRTMAAPLDDWGDDPFGTLAAQVPRNAVSLCGSNYTCRTAADGTHYWSSAADDAGEPSRACRVDLLAAAAQASGCRVDHDRSFPEQCLRSNPMLTSDDGTTLLQVRNEQTTGMPTVLSANLKCVEPDSPTRLTQDHMELLGNGRRQLALLHLQRRPEPASRAPVEEAVDAPAPSPAATEWTRCAIPRGPQTAACADDSHCTLPADRAMSLMLRAARDHDVSLTSLSAFLKGMKSKVHDGLQWSSPPSTSRLSEAKLKTRLRERYESDATFRASVLHMIEHDVDFAELLPGARKGLCQAGQCSKSDPKTISTTPLFDGSVPVLFDVRDDGVWYARKGSSARPAPSERCDASRTVRRACDLATEATTLSPGDAVQTTYRVRGGDDEWLVTNALEVHDPAECPTRFCEHHSAFCPSSVCTRDSKSNCVPR